MSHSITRSPSRDQRSPAVRRAAPGRTRRKVDPRLIALGSAAALVGAAAYVQLRTRRAEADNPPAGRFVEVDGVRLHYVEQGSGEPLVLLHGNGAMIQDFASSGLIDLAAQHYRVVAFDRPGYGHSERPRSVVWTPEAQAQLFAKAFRQLGIDRPVVLGHSWGTQVAVALGLNHPESLRALVLLSGFFFPTVRLDAALFSPPALPVIGDLLRFTVSPLIGRAIWPLLMRKIFGPNPTPEHFKGFPKWMALRPGQIRAAAEEAAVMVSAAARLSRRYRELRLPAVIVAGTADRQVMTRRQSWRLHQELPGSSFHPAPGVGHMVHHFIPEAVLEAIDEAAARTRSLSLPAAVAPAIE